MRIVCSTRGARNWSHLFPGTPTLGGPEYTGQGNGRHGSYLAGLRYHATPVTPTRDDCRRDDRRIVLSSTGVGEVNQLVRYTTTIILIDVFENLDLQRDRSGHRSEQKLVSPVQWGKHIDRTSRSKPMLWA